MRRIEQFVEEIVQGLPGNNEELVELREEWTGHLMEHAGDLMMQGYTKDEAVEVAIASFGKKESLQKEMKKVLFPYYKFVRFGFTVVAVALLICFTSHLMEMYYFPRHDSPITMGLFLVMVVICFIVIGAIEVIFETMEKELGLNWYTNIWVILFTPAVSLQTFLLWQQFQQLDHSAFWIYEDYLFLPLYIIFYVICRQFFTGLFIRKSLKRKHIRIR